MAKKPMDQVEEDIKKLKITKLRHDYDRYIAAAAKPQQSPNEVKRMKQLAAEKLVQILKIEKE